MNNWPKCSDKIYWSNPWERVDKWLNKRKTVPCSACGGWVLSDNIIVYARCPLCGEDFEEDVSMLLDHYTEDKSTEFIYVPEGPDDRRPGPF